MFDKLLKEVEYAKTCIMKRQALYQAYGRITMAWELGGITADEYMTLNHACVYDGINNPKYFD